MTEESKQRLLKYLSGTMDVGTQSNIPINHYQITNNLNDYITNNISDTFVFYDIISCNDFEGSILYGNYLNATVNAYRGVLVILDNNFNPVGNITKYSSGVDISAFLELKFDEDNYLYGIDILSGTDNRRFIMLTNPLATTDGTYNLKLRTSYYLSGNTTLYSPTVIDKVIGEPIYIFGGLTGNLTQVLTTLKINVGESNEWTNYTNTTIEASLRELYYVYDSENSVFTTLGGIALGMSSTKNTIYKCTASGTSLNEIGYTIGTYVNIPAITLKNMDEVYLIASDGGDIYIGKYDFNTSTFNILDSSEDGYYTTQIKAINNIVVSSYTYVKDSQYYEVIDFFDKDDNISKLTVEIPEFTYDDQFNIYVNNIYNLYNIYTLTPSNNIVEIYQVIYNSNNSYNGGEYEDYNSLNPIYVNLLDEDGNYLFSRNLYNKVIHDKRTVSTVEIPNILVNDISIAEKNLISATNTKIVNNTNSITKNIYETLYISFNNGINIKNDITGEYNDNGATRLNLSTTSIFDYQNALLNKYRINYLNNTNSINEIADIKYNSTTKIVTLTFNIYVESEIESIDLISNDENTTYNTITVLSDNTNVSDFTPGKYYKVIQNIEIGE